jgi:hypothetical protein
MTDFMSPLVPSEELYGNKGSRYAGTQSVTRNGNTCRNWDELIDGSHYSWKNYCRNPEGDQDTIWCFVGDGTMEYCNPYEPHHEPATPTPATDETTTDCPTSA